jgi:hypothetical protein
LTYRRNFLADERRRPSVQHHRWNLPPLNADGKTSRHALEIIAALKFHHHVKSTLSPRSGLVNRNNARLPMNHP